MSNETEKLDALRKELVKEAVEFLQEDGAILSPNGVYHYQSACGRHILSLDSYLASFKEFLIEKGYVTENY